MGAMAAGPRVNDVPPAKMRAGAALEVGAIVVAAGAFVAAGLGLWHGLVEHEWARGTFWLVCVLLADQATGWLSARSERVWPRRPPDSTRRARPLR